MTRPSTPRPPSGHRPPATDEAWLRRLRAGLDHTNDHLDDATASALQQARQQALRLQRTTAPTPSRTPRWLPLWAGAAAAALVITVYWPQSRQPVSPADHPARPALADTAADPVTDLALLAQDDFLLFEEDLEFYAWVEDELNTTG